MSARNATVAVKSAKSASAENCDKREQDKSPKIKKIFSLKIVGSEKMFYPALKYKAPPAKKYNPKDIFCVYKIIR